jgi:hypothetical protein
LRNQANMDSTYNESLNAWPAHFLRKEAAEKEASKKEVDEKGVAKDDDDEEEDQQTLPSRTSNDDGPVSPIRFPRVMRWLKCPICLNYLYEHKNGLHPPKEKVPPEEQEVLAPAVAVSLVEEEVPIPFVVVPP